MPIFWWWWCWPNNNNMTGKNSFPGTGATATMCQGSAVALEDGLVTFGFKINVFCKQCSSCIGKNETWVAGEDCSRPCPAGKFGPNCVHDCYCHNGNIHNRSPKKTKIQLYTCFYSHFYRRSALQSRRWQMQMQARLSSPSSRNIHPHHMAPMNFI